MSTGASEVVAVMLGITVAWLTKTRVIPGVFSFLVAIVGGIMYVKTVLLNLVVTDGMLWLRSG